MKFLLLCVIISSGSLGAFERYNARDTIERAKIGTFSSRVTDYRPIELKVLTETRQKYDRMVCVIKNKIYICTKKERRNYEH